LYRRFEPFCVNAPSGDRRRGEIVQPTQSTARTTTPVENVGRDLPMPFEHREDLDLGVADLIENPISTFDQLAYVITVKLGNPTSGTTAACSAVAASVLVYRRAAEGLSSAM
jgi:hypothetical protein